MLAECRWCEADFNALASRKTWVCPVCRGTTFNPRYLSYSTSKVGSDRTLGQIMSLFEKFSALIRGYGVMADPDSGTAGVDFLIRTRDAVMADNPEDGEEWIEGGIHCRFVMPIPATRSGHRQAWRLVLGWLEHTLEAVALGAVRAEDAFLSYAVGSVEEGGQIREVTVGEMFRGRLDRRILSLPGLSKTPIRLDLKALPAPRDDE